MFAVVLWSLRSEATIDCHRCNVMFEWNREVSQHSVAKNRWGRSVLTSALHCTSTCMYPNLLNVLVNVVKCFLAFHLRH
jgi:hypothetical protein